MFWIIIAFVGGCVFWHFLGEHLVAVIQNGLLKLWPAKASTTATTTTPKV